MLNKIRNFFRALAQWFLSPFLDEDTRQGAGLILREADRGYALYDGNGNFVCRCKSRAATVRAAADNNILLPTKD